VIAAKNMEKTLDEALTRPGRFDKKVSIGFPDQRVRKEMIEYYLKNRHASNVTEKELQLLSRTAAGFSGADINNLVNIAAMKAVIGKMQKITLSLLRDAIDEVIMGPERLSKQVPLKSARSTAFHEGGHAMVAVHNKQQIFKATIVPRGDALGFVSYVNEDEDKKNQT